MRMFALVDNANFAVPRPPDLFSSCSARTGPVGFPIAIGPGANAAHGLIRDLHVASIRLYLVSCHCMVCLMNMHGDTHSYAQRFGQCKRFLVLYDHAVVIARSKIDQGDRWG